MCYYNYGHRFINTQKVYTMPRPVKWRRVAEMPQVNYFKPAGIPLRVLDEVCLSVEEAEAIRLKDLEGLQQEECAERMHISRPTFHRVLESARQKVADALLKGKAIRIAGGNFEMAMRRFRCDNDGQEWDVPFEAMVDGPPVACPRCNSLNIQPVLPLGCGFGGRGWGRGRQRGRRSW
jgi:predicted DNA-binding protein (UPF0251 family)